MQILNDWYLGIFIKFSGGFKEGPKSPPLQNFSQFHVKSFVAAPAPEGWLLQGSLDPPLQLVFKVDMFRIEHECNFFLDNSGYCAQTG